MRSQLIGRFKFQPSYIVPVLVVFAFFGAVFLIRSFAAVGDVVAFESEQGQASGSVTIGDDTAASGGKYAMFGGNPTPAPQPPAPVPATPPALPSKKLLLLEQGAPRISYAGSHVSKFDGLPFHGAVLSSDASSHVQSTTALSANTVNTEFKAITPSTFTNLKENFLMVYATPAGPYTNYGQVVSNFKIISAAAKNSGFKGIFFDVEEYFGGTWDSSGCQGMNDTTCASAAETAGKQVMQGIIQAWPAAKVIVSHGPYVSEPASAAYLNRYFPYNDVAWANKMVGHFEIGMARAVLGTQAYFIDGGEEYVATDPEDFQAVHDWQTKGFANTPLMPLDLKPRWDEAVDGAQGVYDFPSTLEQKSGSPAQIEQDIKRSLPVVDEYVWFYTERYNWTGNSTGKPAVPSDWMQAVRNGYAAAQ